jgi:hypothetical protein
MFCEYEHKWNKQLSEMCARKAERGERITLRWNLRRCSFRARGGRKEFKIV